MIKISQKAKNEEFIESYQLKGDGSLSDTIMANAKKILAEDKLLTPEQRMERERHYNEKISKIVNACVRSTLWDEPNDQ